jgi:hypothetical protein
MSVWAGGDLAPGAESTTSSRSLDSRPKLDQARFISVLIAILVLGSTLIGVSNGLDTEWVISNGVLYLILEAYLLHRIGTQNAGPLSAGNLVVAVLMVYGSWAPALAIGQTTNPVLPGHVSEAGLAYTTFAATVVAFGMTIVEFTRLRGRGRISKVQWSASHEFTDSRAWWHGVLLLELIGLACFFLYKYVSGLPIVSFALFQSPSGATSSVTQLPTALFLSAGIDVSIGAGIAATGLLFIRRYRNKVILLLLVNLTLYATIGFKYRIVTLLLGVFSVWATSRAVRGKSTGKRHRVQIVIVAIAVTAAAFFTVGVFRGNHASGRVTSASSFGVKNLANIASNSINIAAPYAAIHQEHLPLLMGESYTQLPLLFAPRSVLPDKPAPTMVVMIQAVTVRNAGSAVPLWAEADVNFGLVGLLGFGLLVGSIVRGADGMDRRRFESAAVASAVAAVLLSVLSRSIMFFAVYDSAAVILPVWLLSYRMHRRWIVRSSGATVLRRSFPRPDGTRSGPPPRHSASWPS